MFAHCIMYVVLWLAFLCVELYKYIFLYNLCTCTCTEHTYMYDTCVHVQYTCTVSAYVCTNVVSGEFIVELLLVCILVILNTIHT